MSDILSDLRAVGEETRLRLILLLSLGELTVANLTNILDQSQPRISRHLKILGEAGVIERYPEGAQVLCRVSRAHDKQALLTAILDRIDQDQAPYSDDLKALDVLTKEREELATRYFEQHAANWDYVRALYVAENEIEQALKASVNGRSFHQQLDLGTGTGRLIDLFRDQVKTAVGIDNSHAMLSIARSRLDPANDNGIEIRHAHIDQLPDALTASNDLITIHMVLCYVSDPLQVIRESAKAMTKDGSLLIVDFCPHDREELRKERAHRRLGFSKTEIQHWAEETGLNMGDFTILKGASLDVFVTRLDRQSAISRNQQSG